MAVKKTLKSQAEAETLALSALGWTLSDDQRASRLLALTGLDPDGIRARVDDRIFLAETLRFLEDFEPDLLACAEALSEAPFSLIEARQALER